MNQAIFLDRDNTIIIDKGYLKNPEEIEFIPGVLSALRSFQDAGFILVMVSNQSGIGRGYFTESEYDVVHAYFVELLEVNGITFAGYYYCPHSPNDNCECRKPKPLLAHKAANELNIDLSESYMIGDKDSDIEFGKRFGAKECFCCINDLSKHLSQVE